MYHDLVCMKSRTSKYKIVQIEYIISYFCNAGNTRVIGNSEKTV